MATATNTSYYEVLNVDMKAEAFVIHAAYRALMLKYHPDKFEGDPQIGERKSREINEAYEVLRDSDRRAEYDRTLMGSRARDARSEEQSRGPEHRREGPETSTASSDTTKADLERTLGSDRAHNFLSAFAMILAITAGTVWWHRIVNIAVAQPAPLRSVAKVAAPAPLVTSETSRSTQLETQVAERQISRIETEGSTLTFLGPNGVTHSLDVEGTIRDATISPDAGSVALAIAGEGANGDRITLVDAASSNRKDLGDFAALSLDSDPVLISRVRFSLDGGYVYAEISRWATSSAIAQISLSGGQPRLVIDGNGLRVMRNGPWRGFLLVSRHQYRSEGGSYDPAYLVRPDGHVQMMVPGTDEDDTGAALEKWLSEKGWTAD